MNRTHAHAIYALTLAFPLLAACSKPSTSDAPAVTSQPVAAPEPPPPPPDPAADARKLFNSKCVVCHGNHGAGDGPGAAALTPKPRAFSDAAWQASVTDDQIRKTILEGGAAVGKSPAMPPNPELAEKPAEVTALLKIVRDFKQ